MSQFSIDQQTIDDLEIFKGYGAKSLFQIFDKTKTIEGSATLKSIFTNPLTSSSLISQRIALIEQLQMCNIKFDLDKESIDFIEFYLRQNSLPKKTSLGFRIIQVVYDKLNPSRELYLRNRGTNEVIQLIRYLDNLRTDLKDITEYPFLNRLYEILASIKSNKAISDNISSNKEIKFSASLILDHEIRRCEKSKINQLLSLVYELDAYFAVAKTAQCYQLTYPVISDSKENFIQIEGLRHLFIENPIVNDFSLSFEKNVSFITGVNMAGKSTFLKSVGIAVYLSHLGFPVPAQHMTSTIFDGLVTTINLSDNLAAGYSHFYNEVKRVKDVAHLTTNSRTVVIFDELFRGTNVIDAHDASISIIKAFSKISTCLFLVSTHIIEVAQELESNLHIDFRYLETQMINGSPVFSRQLLPGISTDRMGHWIISNEGILKILNENANR